MKRLKKNDVILMLIVIFAAALIFFISRFVGKKGAYAVVYVDGVEKERFILTENVNIRLKGYEGGFNELVIENGEAYLRNADCPDKLCVHEGAISAEGESIICLPHRVVITVEGGQKSGLDAVAE